MFGFANTNTVREMREMPEEELIARVIARAMHGDSQYWQLYLPATQAVQSKILNKAIASGGLFG
jgi:hypothetical protein